MNEWIPAFNSFAEEWLRAMGRASWQGSGALVLVWAACRAWPKMPASVRCWLWRLAYLKWLVALLWTTPVALPLLPVSPAPPVLASAADPGALSLPSLRPPASDTSSGPAGPLALPRTLPNVTSGLLLLWLLGGGWWSMRVGQEWRRAQRLRRRGGPVSEEWLAACCTELSQRFRLRRRPQLMAAEDLDSPLALGGLRPAIVLPSSLLAYCTPAELRLMLAHEVAHLKRGDLLWGWLPTVVKGLFFFHPVVWLAPREWLLAQEMACDEFAVGVTQAPLAHYGNVLLKVAAQGGPNLPLSPATVGVVESYSTLKRRLLAMKYRGSVSRRRWMLTGLILAVLGIMGLVPWRATAQAASPRLELEPGQEFVYTGTGQLTNAVTGYDDYTWTFSLRQVPLVAERTRQRGARLHVLQSGQHTSGGLHSGWAFLAVSEVGSDLHPVSAEERPFALGDPGRVAPPVSFPTWPKAALKVGATWSTEEAFPHLCLPSLPYRYEVAASEIVNDQVCWRIEKRLADPLPRVAPWAYNKKITVRNLTERFWITQKPPLRLWQYEYESDLATSTPEGDGEYRTRQSVHLTLEKARTLSREELAGRKRQFTGLFDLQNRFQKVRSVPIVRWPQENPTEALRQIAASLGAWTRAYPRSSYQPAGDALRQGVEQHQQEYNHQMKR